MISIKNNTLRITLLAALSLSMIVSTSAKADVLLAKTKTSPSIFGGASYSVDFNGPGAGGVTFNFTTNQANRKVVFMFNAECVVHGNAYKWVNIDIRVNPAGPSGEFSVKPTNSDNALCSGNSTNSNVLGNGDGWVSASSIGVATLANAGTHTVRVRVIGNSTVTRLDDMSLIVMD